MFTNSALLLHDGLSLQASMTRGTHIMWTMGSDFQYEAAETWFINMDKIIRGVNAAGKGVKVCYQPPHIGQ